MEEEWSSDRATENQGKLARRAHSCAVGEHGPAIGQGPRMANTARRTVVYVAVRGRATVRPSVCTVLQFFRLFYIGLSSCFGGGVW